MTEKFFGEKEELEAAVSRAGYQGNWKENASNSSWQFRSRSGEILNWWTNTGTLSFQGKNQADFEEALLAVIKGDDGGVRDEASLGSKKIFVVHGHDKDARDQLELILHRLGLEPFILQNAESGSQTIIEALEGSLYKDTALGIVLMTPDDFGYSKDGSEAERQPRARQNVVLEMGMVMASLGRERMLILKKGAIELPSDVNGLIYHEFNGHVRETVPKIAERLEALGFDVDPAQISVASS